MLTRRLLLSSAAAAMVSTPPSTPSPTVFELRNYAMQPGRRDELIELFDTHFTESQEALGSRILGSFRNLDDPNRWVWIRAFADMEVRQKALTDFYTGDVWKQHRTAANATIADVSDVFLLKPLSGDAFANRGARPPVGATVFATTLVQASVYYVAPRGEEDFFKFFSAEVEPQLQAMNAAPLASFGTEHRPNSYPRLPIRSDTVFVTLTRFESIAAHDAHVADKDRSTAWRRIDGVIASRVSKPNETWRLQPSPRSSLR
jgi:quinol monooxygenase YgiN